MSRLKILMIDDDKSFCELLIIILERKGYSVEYVISGELGLEKLSTAHYDVVLTDLRMSGMSGMDVLKGIKELYPDEYSRPSCIMITGYGTIDNAVEAIRNGAFSYFIKSKDPEELLFDIEKIQRLRALDRENRILKSDGQHIPFMVETKSATFLKVLESARKVARTDVNVMLLGESGVGKEVIARYIHRVSGRSGGVFMPVNCYAFSDSMIEAELYGHEKGAFTGAQELRIGRFEAAHQGTLFLDEVGDIPLSVQIKLLRNIENKEIQRIGSNKSIHTDFRLISATHKNLEDAISSHQFREDLYYRMNTVVLDIPPLRERKEDIPLLVDYFLKRSNHEMKKQVKDMDDKVLEALVRYDYPGNIRELKNIIERLLVFAEGDQINYDDILKHPILPATVGAMNVSENFRGNSNASSMTLKDVRESAENKHIMNVFKLCEKNVEETAKVLDISVRQLYNRLKGL
jgi:two-component system response regulator HydG